MATQILEDLAEQSNKNKNNITGGSNHAKWLNTELVKFAVDKNLHGVENVLRGNLNLDLT